MHNIAILISALAIAEVTPWTIDLPEARKFIFEKNDRLEKMRNGEHKKTEIDKQIFFSNRYDSNSKYHDKTEKADHDGSYAKEYGYQSYTEERVRDIVYEGSEYMAGLQRSIEAFTELLENCSRTNETQFPNTNATNAATPLNTTAPWRPMTERGNYTFADGGEQCRRATSTSEHVRRLAALAIHAAKELQDIAYSRKYMKDDPHELSKQENELILKLAWLLDRLAHFTGYYPQPQQHVHDEPPSTTTAQPGVASLVNASPETTRLMMNCLKRKSAVPATIRCAYPDALPQAVLFILNSSNPLPGGLPSSSNRDERVLPPSPPATSEQELLIASASGGHVTHHLTAVKHVVKRHLSEQVPRIKIKTDDSAVTFMKYFVKHKIWESLNPSDKLDHFVDDFDVSNDVHRVQKRSTRFEVPDDPFQDLSKYVKNKKGVQHVTDETQAQKIKNFIDKIRTMKSTTEKDHNRRIFKLFRAKRLSKRVNDRLKRSYTYENDVNHPRDHEDLYKDISYYIKSKPGTFFNRDFVQAGQVTAGLSQIFLNPNIETVRRYGSNYNPLIPDPLIFSALRSAADS